MIAIRHFRSARLASPIWLLTAALCCRQLLAFELQVVNVTNHELRGYPVVVRVEALPAELQRSNLRVLSARGEELLCQADDLDADGQPDELAFLADLAAGQRAVFRVVQGARRGGGSDIEVGDDFAFANAALQCQAIAEGGPGIRVHETAGAKPYIESLRLAGADRAKPDTRVLATGPVRAIVEQRWTSDGGRPPLAACLRYVLYAGHRGVRVELRFRNLGDQAVALPAFLSKKGVFEASLGPLLTEQMRRTELLSVNQFRSSRPNVLWANLATGHALGIAYHSPHWRWYGPTLWAGACNTLEGLVVHSRSEPPGVTPMSGRHIHTEKNGKLVFGRILQFPARRDHVLFRRMWWKKGSRFELAPRQQRVFAFTLLCYRGGRDEAVAAFAREAETAVRAMNVVGPEGQVLAVAEGPQFVEETFDAAERWREEPGASLALRGGVAELRCPEPGRGAWTALHRDFSDPTELRVQIAALSDGAALEVSLRDLSDGAEHRLGRFSEAGRFRADVSEACPLFGPRRCILRLRLVGKSGPLRAEIEELVLAWPIPRPPELLSPRGDFPLTDIALSFAICSNAREQCERAYRFQIAEDPRFRSVVREHTFPNVIRPSTSRSQPYRVYTPREACAPGDYWLRARAMSVLGELGPWGEAVKFTIGNTDHEPRPPVRGISPRRPLFLIPPKRRQAAQQMWDALPEGIRALTAIGPTLNEIKEEPRAWLEETRFPMVVRLSHNVTGHPDLAYLEYLFATCPRVVGFTYAESIFPSRFAARNLVLAAKHGRFFGLIAGGPGGGINQILPGANRGFYDLLETHGEYFLPIMKSQNPYSPLAGYVNLVGLWLAGRPARWGAETEYWMPKKVGLSGKKQRPVDWMPPFLLGLAYGAQAWRVETFISNKEECRGWDPDSGQFDELWHRAIGPFFEDLLAHQLIPSRQDVLSTVKVAFHPSPEVGIAEARGVEYYPFEAVNAAHGVPTHQHQWVPDNPRCGIVPVLPVRVTAEERARFAATPRPRQFRSPREVTAFLERHYPPTRSAAFTVLAGDTGVITNSHDHPREAKPQRFHLQLAKGPAEAIEGAVGFHQYLLLKQGPRRLFIHANNYSDATSTFVLACPRRPSVRVEPAGALIEERWEEATSTLTLTLGHEHKAGVARVFVE
ncbi:MAG: DUF4861 family protein [bacterium]